MVINFVHRDHIYLPIHIYNYEENFILNYTFCWRILGKKSQLHFNFSAFSVVPFKNNQDTPLVNSKKNLNCFGRIKFWWPSNYLIILKNISLIWKILPSTKNKKQKLCARIRNCRLDFIDSFYCIIPSQTWECGIFCHKYDDCSFIHIFSFSTAWHCCCSKCSR